MSNQNQQHDSSIDENKESLTFQSILSEHESQEQDSSNNHLLAFYNYITQYDQLNHLNNDFEENVSAIEENVKVSIKKGQQKDHFKKNIHNNKIKKTQYKKKIKRIKEFEPEEDIKLLSLVHKHGRQFSRIVKLFPKRTVSMLKNRYYKNLRYRWEELLGIEYSENDDDQKTLNQVDMRGGNKKSIDHQDLINMIPNSYSCPIIGDMLSQFITKMDQFLKFQF